jgi:hypothetical protein
MKRHFTVILSISLLLLCSLAGCSLEQRCNRRLAFLEKNCPQCFEPVTLRDTIITEAVRYDTSFVMRNDTVADTFVMEKERVKVQVVRLHETLLVQAEVKADTIYIERESAVLQHPRTGAEKCGKLCTLLISLVCILILIWFIKKETMTR